MKKKAQIRKRPIARDPIRKQRSAASSDSDDENDDDNKQQLIIEITITINNI